jgi:hypothetical protein
VSDIRQVDATPHAKRVLAERSPAQDFARELAKTGDGKVAEIAQSRGSPAVDRPVRVFAGSSKSSVDVSHASSWASVVVTPAIATQEQLSVAVQPTGITEALLGSRVYGVHLLASAYLSELTTRGEPDPEALADVTLPTMTNTPAQSYEAVSNVPPDLSGTTHNASLHEEAVAMLSSLVESEATEAVSHTQSTGSASAVSAEASTMLWPESSLRLTRQRDGSAVIWLRDYRMPHEEASQVVDVLMKGAEAAGIRLGRIVLNGREVWTSPKNY